ncbi:hypothetical protein ANO11243_079480 [Dothideomycetidae sp. 11243]|nr:hypothetical protein ANO11243_079480 [fungal sp. No.11243]
MLIPDLSSINVEDATCLLASAVKAFGISQSSQDRRSCFPAYDYQTLVETLLRLGADPNYRVGKPLFKPLLAVTYTKWCATSFSLLEWCLLFCVKAAELSGVDETIVEHAQKWFPIMDVLVDHGADLPTGIIQFRSCHGLYMAMNFATFALYMWNMSDCNHWQQLCRRSQSENPVLVCDVVGARKRFASEVRGLGINFWLKRRPPRHVNHYFYDCAETLEPPLPERPSEDSIDHTYRVVWYRYLGPWKDWKISHEFPCFRDRPLIKNAQVILNNERKPHLPYQPTEEDLADFQKGLEQWHQLADPIMSEMADRKETNKFCCESVYIWPVPTNLMEGAIVEDPLSDREMRYLCARQSDEGETEYLKNVRSVADLTKRFSITRISTEDSSSDSSQFSSEEEVYEQEHAPTIRHPITRGWPSLGL